MKITKIEPQKKAPGRVNVFVDENFSFGISERMIIDFDLYKGKEVTKEEIDRYKEGDSLGKCLDKAYRFLSFRQRSEKEMRDKLLEKYDEQTVKEAIKKLKEYNFINDLDFSGAWIRSRSHCRGKRALQYELIKKGVAKEIIENALSTIAETDELENALSLIEKKTKYHNLSRGEAYKKIGPFLSRRGYDYETIKEVISKVSGN